jgi:hypothetical protein
VILVKIEKMWRLLVKAFYETFKNKKNKPALILKTSGSGSSYMDRDIILKKN